MPGMLEELRVPGRRAPLGGIGLLHVVHEVEAERVLRAGVERREDAGVAFRRDDLRLLEAGVEGELLHELGALGHADVLGGDRGLLDPVLQARDGFVVAALDLVVDGAELALGVRRQRAWVAAQSAALLAAVCVTKSRRVIFGIVAPRHERGQSLLKVTVPLILVQRLRNGVDVAFIIVRRNGNADAAASRAAHDPAARKLSHCILRRSIRMRQGDDVRASVRVDGRPERHPPSPARLLHQEAREPRRMRLDALAADCRQLLHRGHQAGDGCVRHRRLCVAPRIVRHRERRGVEVEGIQPHPSIRSWAAPVRGAWETSRPARRRRARPATCSRCTRRHPHPSRSRGRASRPVPGSRRR